MPIIILVIFLVSCYRQEYKPEPWQQKKNYHIDTIIRPVLVMADLNTSKIFHDTAYELWITTETGGSPFHYIDKNKMEFPDNILVMPESKKGK